MVSFNFVPGKYSEYLLTGNQLKVAPYMSLSLSHPMLLYGMLLCTIHYSHGLPASQVRSLKEIYLVKRFVKVFRMTMIFFNIFIFLNLFISVAPYVCKNSCEMIRN